MFFNVENVDYLKDLDMLDYTLVKDIDVFIIEGLDTYSISFIDILLARFPQKQIICLDHRADSIWNDSAIICKNLNTSIKHAPGKSMYVFPEQEQEERHTVEVESTLAYNSLHVMQSLCWAGKRTSLGEKNPDKVILLIEFSCKNAGMGDIVISTQQYIRLARQRGWYPVVNLTLENQYISREGDNMWDYYFSQPAGISVQDALQSKTVIRGSENNFEILPWNANPLCNMNDAMRERIFLKPNMIEAFRHQELCHILAEKRTLAVIARGSDLAKCTHLQIDIERMIQETKKIFEDGFQFIFLATETKEYLDAFRREFGDKLLFVDQKRISYDYAKNEYKYVADLLNVGKNHRRKWGEKYLMITYFLSCCNALIYSIPCGALRLANNWRKVPFEFVKCTYQAVGSLEEDQKENIIHIAECADFFEKNSSIIIYGLGDVAEMIYPILEKYRDKIIGCDKRAAFEDYQFHDLKVITPEKLDEIKSNTKILITSPRCGTEIRNELLRSGVENSRIVELDY